MSSLDIEKRLLLKCASLGFAAIKEHLQNYSTEYFSQIPLVPKWDGVDEYSHELRSSKNIGLIYSSIAAMCSGAERAEVVRALGQTEMRSALSATLSLNEKYLYKESEFENELKLNIVRNTELPDQKLSQKIQEKIDVNSEAILNLPVDQSIYFSKVNHGYWEYMRGVYDPLAANRQGFREFDLVQKKRRLQTSAVTQYWGFIIGNWISSTRTTKNCSRFSISLTAGNEHALDSISKNFTPVTRGAAVGLLSMLESAGPHESSYHVADGCATRSLVKNGELSSFFDKFVADSDACVFLVPPHLRNISFRAYSGDIYKFFIPANLVNETWKSVTATFLGYLISLSQKYRTITVLGQGASIISLMALLFSQIETLNKGQVRFFDFGRVLDITTPDQLKKQNWAKSEFSEYISEGKKIFRNVESDDVVLATPF